MNQELNKIKKLYGEAMAKFCRESFPTLLEQEGTLLELLLEKFEPSRFLYEDIVNTNLQTKFKNYIYSLKDIDIEENDITKTPEELLSEVGYNLYECKTEEEIQSFKKYYVPGEELCTFHGGRLEYCRVFFAIKKDIENIKRENFLNPERQDEYGTSVISIQFTKDGTNTLSIKNRYNHKVNNCDATFSNNLDNIIEGLTDSFEKYYGIKQKNNNRGFEIPGYVMANDGKHYKYNYESYNTYYCPNNIVINNFGVQRYEKEKAIVFDCYVLDFVKKKIHPCDQYTTESFQQFIGDIEKIEVKNTVLGKEILIISPEKNKTNIILDKQNRIISLKSDIQRYIHYGFLDYNRTLINIDLQNVQYVNHEFLRNNQILENLNMPNLKMVGESFLRSNRKLKKLNLPLLEFATDNFLELNNSLERINLPNLKEVGHNFLYKGGKIVELELPKLEKIGADFMYSNSTLLTLNLPNVKEAGYAFLHNNKILKKLYLPKLELVMPDFLYYNDALEELELLSATRIASNFLYSNTCLRKISLPNVSRIVDNFLFENNSLESLSLPNLNFVANCFCCSNRVMKNVNLPQLCSVGGNFLEMNCELEKIDFPRLRIVGSGFIESNEKISEINMPNLQYVDKDFLPFNTSLKELNFPNLENSEELEPRLRKILK